MKAIIYAGIGLFSVATVYGVVDYYNTQKKGTMDKLYKEPEEVVITDEPQVTTTIVPANLIKTNTVKTVADSKVKKKLKKLRRTIRLEDFSRGRIEEPLIKEIVAQPVKEEVKKQD